MNIRPTHTGRSDAPPDRLREAAPAGSSPADRTAKPEPVASPVDRVELTSMAHDLLQRVGTQRPTASSLTPERLRQLLDRLASGHYDRPEVRIQVLERLRADLESGSTGS